MKIKQLPLLDRPREKLVAYGPTRLSQTELLAVVLGSGQPGQNVLELARKLILKFSRDSFRSLTYESLAATFGLGPSRSAALIAALELGRRIVEQQNEQTLLTAQDVWLLLYTLRKAKREAFTVFYLDTRRTILARETVSVGTVSAAIVHPREVFEPALRYLASYIIVAHNHPTGDPTPSDEDIKITERLIEAGKILGITVIDHVIIGRDSYYSMQQAQLSCFCRKL